MTKTELIARIDRAHDELLKALQAYHTEICETLEALDCEHGCDYEQDIENLDDIMRVEYALECELEGRAYLKRTNEHKCNNTHNDTEWTRYWGVDADEYECDDYANEAED